ncbi:MAG: hypothetical protein ACLFN9_21805 [Desulfococcaceae bacterium]
MGRWLAWQIVLWMAGAGLAWMILTLQEDIAAALRKYNERIMAKVYTLEDFIFNLQHRLQVFFDELLAGIEADITGAMESILPSQVETILRAIGMAQWIDAFFSEMADAAGNAVADTVATVTAPAAGLVRNVRWRMESISGALDAVAGGIDAAEEKANAKIDGLFSNLQAMVDGVNDRITALKEQVTKIEERVNAEVKGIHEGIKNAVKSATDAANAQIDGLFSKLQAMVDGFNARIGAIKDRVTAIEERVNGEVRDLYNGVADPVNGLLDSHNARVDGMAASLQALVDRFNSRVNEIKGKAEAGEPIEWEAYRYTISDIGIDPSTYHIDYRVPDLAWSFSAGIDFESYEVALSDFGISREDYRIDIEVPALEWSFSAGIDFDAYLVSLSDYGIDREDYRIDIEVPALDDARIDMRLALEDICDVETRLELMPQDVRSAFMDHYPAFLKTNFEERLKQFFIVALTAALVQQIERIRAAFDDARGRVESYFVEAKESVIRQTEEISDDILEAQMSFINALPDVLEPALKKQVERIKEKVVEAQDEILANIDDLYIDTAAVDHIVQRVAKRPAKDAPVKFDSQPWTLDDIYRMLCNYYYRHERMALAMIIATQDMGLSTEDMQELLLSMGAPDVGEDDFYAA